MPNRIFSLEVVRTMTDALKDCFLVFLAAALAFLTNYYLVNHRTDRITVTQPQQTVSSISP
jgi:hypothetical protein